MSDGFVIGMTTLAVVLVVLFGYLYIESRSPDHTV